MKQNGPSSTGHYWSAVPSQPLAIWMQVGCGIILGACFAGVCGCPACDGTYVVEVDYANADADNTHMFVSEKETFGLPNRVPPQGVRTAQYSGAFFNKVSESSLCEGLETTARANPQTWTFVAGRNGEVLGSQTLTINYDDIRESHIYSVNVVWNGATVTVTRR